MCHHGLWICFLLGSAELLLGHRDKDGEDSTVIPMSWEDTNADAIVFDAFGEKYRLKLLPGNKKSVEDVGLYTSRHGVINTHTHSNQPLDVYTDGDTIVAVRHTRARRAWAPQMDGLISTRAGHFYVRSRPNMMFHSSIGHYVSRRNSHNLHNDYYRIKNQVDDVISMRRREKKNIRAVVDLLAIVDYSLYRSELAEHNQNEAAALAELRSYYKLLISMVDFRYSHIEEHDLSIRVRLVGIYVAQDPRGSPWTEEHVVDLDGEQIVEPGVALENLHFWLKKQFEDKVLPNHDHAMAFTGYTLFNMKTGTDTAGMAYIGTICKVADGYSASVIEEYGAFANIGTVTHELGHSLGAHHDGSDENSDCPAENNFLMTPQNLGGDNSKNFFSFSRCSLRDFKDKLRMEQADCLFDSQPTVYKGKLPGQLMEADQQCSSLFGEGSRLCPIEQMTKNICLRLWCQKPNKPQSCVTTRSLAAIYGTPCGEGKVCIHGNCQAENSIKTTPKPVDCPRGDQNQRYCYRVVLLRPQACKRPDIKSYCCRSCRRLIGGR